MEEEERRAIEVRQAEARPPPPPDPLAGRPGTAPPAGPAAGAAAAAPPAASAPGPAPATTPAGRPTSGTGENEEALGVHLDPPEEDERARRPPALSGSCSLTSASPQEELPRATRAMQETREPPVKAPPARRRAPTVQPTGQTRAEPGAEGGVPPPPPPPPAWATPSTPPPPPGMATPMATSPATAHPGMTAGVAPPPRTLGRRWQREPTLQRGLGSLLRLPRNRLITSHQPIGSSSRGQPRLRRIREAPPAPGTGMRHPSLFPTLAELGSLPHIPSVEPG